MNALSKNVIELTQLENGDFEFNFNNKDMDNIIIHDWLKSDFSCRNLLAAAALCCTSGSMLYELDVRKPGAKYKDLKSSVTWRTGKDDEGRIIIESLNVKVQVDVPEEHLAEFKEVLKEHEDNMCFIVRSLNRGIKTEIEITRT